MAQPAEGFDETKKYNLWNLLLLAPGANVITALPERVVCYLILFKILAYEMTITGNVVCL